ncbi:conserved hypothetical protein (plasmid) [Candidatus Protochlamydia naegleriophila]|uniref:Uncharacterized protein n=1 Tax=Candidatus Protochlamydia naegleriophila TaxID=389348 RepID=A0A0U5JH40_9BACT|nr:hypothetical protein [Candidatus Protochlamydia naegleriophila]CUI18116.1 conserved hypothetical protein [Candidatus Protochlamydia naegleriophila]
MRILDQETDQSLNNIILYLTSQEAQELRDSLEDVINKPLNNHSHIPSNDFEKEITVCIYDENNLKGFNERSINIILNDQ